MPLIPISDEEKEKVRPLHFEDPDIIEKDMIYIKEWISKQPHLPQKHDDVWLRSFLTGCKFSLETCKKKLEAHFLVRTQMPQYFLDPDPTSEEIRKDVKHTAIFILPKLHPDGNFVAFAKLLDYDPENYSVVNAIKRATMLSDCLVGEVRNHGVIFVVDCEGATLNHGAKVTPTILRDLAFCLKYVYPFSMIGYHIINAPSYLEPVRKIASSFFPEEIIGRVRLHSKIEELYEFVPKEILPNEYGGNSGTVAEINDEFQRSLESYKDWLLEHSAKTIDKSKRTQRIFPTDIFDGIEGSFRKLNVD